MQRYKRNTNCVGTKNHKPVLTSTPRRVMDARPRTTNITSSPAPSSSRTCSPAFPSTGFPPQWRRGAHGKSGAGSTSKQRTYTRHGKGTQLKTHRENVHSWVRGGATSASKCDARFGLDRAGCEESPTHSTGRLPKHP